MGCCSTLENGRPPFSTFVRTADVSTPLALSWTAPYWAKVVQVTATWSAIPTTAENMRLWKDHPGGTLGDVTIIQFDPSPADKNWSDWICNEVWYLEPGEIVKLEYPDSDGFLLSAEIYTQRLDK